MTYILIVAAVIAVSIIVVCSWLYSQDWDNAVKLAIKEGRSVPWEDDPPEVHKAFIFDYWRRT